MNKRLRTASMLTALLLMLYQVSLFAGIYKWTDENGQVHYGQNPGAMNAEKMTIRSNETTKPRVIKTPENQLENGAQNSTDAPEEIQPETFVEKKIPEKERRHLCQQAKGDIASINSRGRMREINAKGEYRYLTEEQKQQRLNAAKKRKKKYCR